MTTGKFCRYLNGISQPSFGSLEPPQPDFPWRNVVDLKSEAAICVMDKEIDTGVENIAFNHR